MNVYFDFFEVIAYTIAGAPITVQFNKPENISFNYSSRGKQIAAFTTQDIQLEELVKLTANPYESFRIISYFTDGTNDDPIQGPSITTNTMLISFTEPPEYCGDPVELNVIFKNEGD